MAGKTEMHFQHNLVKSWGTQEFNEKKMFALLLKSYNKEKVVLFIVFISQVIRKIKFLSLS